MTSVPFTDSAPAQRHDVIAFAATTAAAITGQKYKALYFGASGNADVVDSLGNKETVPVIAGLVYPLQNFGVVTGGGTTVSAGSVLGLFD